MTTPVTRVMVGAALGAAAMYWLDPATGRRRRALLRDRLGRAAGDFAEGIGVGGRDLWHRTRGIDARMRSVLTPDNATDEVLVERVRAALGRAVSHPGAIDVAARDGRVRLSGAVLAREHAALMDVVVSVRGVKEMLDELAVYESAQGVPSLQGGRPLRGSRFGSAHTSWSPAARLLAGTCGGGLMFLGARRILGTQDRGVFGGIALAVGGLLLARSITNTPVRRLAGITHRYPIEIRKTMHVEAPIEEVFEVLADYENFPAFMRNVRSVNRYADGRSRWVVAGPAGVPVEWDAETTAYEPNELLAWRTLADSAVAHAGIIRFERAGAGTRLHIEMAYAPPAGALGHVVVKLFGADPKTELDADLVRLKTFLETGVPARDAAHARQSASGRDRLRAATVGSAPGRP
jgi:uncharacterized membrane protein